jgi:hypothetical protein
MFSIIKDFFFGRKIHRDILGNKAHRILKNMNEIQSIGIVFEGSENDSVMVIHHLEKILKQEGKSVRVFGYINSKDSKQEDYWITNKDLNWYGYPMKKSLDSFAEKPFDVIFGIFDNSRSPLLAIFAKSNAEIRIGKCKNDQYGVFDILINAKEQTNKAFANAVIEFLTNIRTK